MTLYSAGFSSFRSRDEDGIIPCAVWYPSQSDESTLVQGVYDFSVAKEGDIVEGNHKLLVISHGSGGTRFGHCKLAEMLARNGYIVLAVEHPKNNFFDDSGVGSAQSYKNRSRHVHIALEDFINKSKWSAHIDLHRIAILGFSLGGFTALTCVGAKPYVAGVKHHIRANREFDPIFSGYEVIVRDGYDEAYLPVTPTPRFKACIAMAPVSGGLFPKDSLKDVKVPVQLFRAEHDMILRSPFHCDQIRENLPQSPEFHLTKRAGHFSYLCPVREEAKARLGELANDNPGFDRAKAHQEIHQLILTFLNKSLS